MSEYTTLTGHSGSVYSCAFSPDNKYLFSAAEDNTARLWSLETKTNVVCYKGMEMLYIVAIETQMLILFIKGTTTQCGQLIAALWVIISQQHLTIERRDSGARITSIPFGYLLV